MDRLYIYSIHLLGFINISQISGLVVELTVTPGDNVTLYCDYNKSSGVYIKWYRNCSHGNQPPLVLNTKFPHQGISLDHDDSDDFLNPFPRFHLVENRSSDSYDLLIVNVSDSDEGLYYCGTEKFKVETHGASTDKYVYSYSDVTTRIELASKVETHNHTNPQDCTMCWRLLFCLCPAVAVFCSLLSSLLVCLFSKTSGSQVDCDDEYVDTSKKHHDDKKRPETRGRTSISQDDDVCYAALEVRQTSQKSKKKTTQTSDFCTYSDINTCRM